MTPSVLSSNDVYALLKVIADPKAAQARLDELVEKETSVSTQFDDLRRKAEEQAEIQKALDNTATEQNAKAQDLASRAVEILSKEQALKAQDDETKKKSEAVSHREQAVKVAEQKVVDAWSKIEDAEAKLKARLEKVSEDEVRVSETKDEYVRKSQALREVVNG